jgi:hypothetical protein
VVVERHNARDALGREPKRLDPARLRIKPERSGRHDAERTFSADEQLLEIKPGVVLAERPQVREHPSICKHSLQPEH